MADQNPHGRPPHEEPGAAPLWAVAAEFGTADGMVAALDVLRDARLGRLDGFSPVPVPEAGRALRLPRQPIHPFALIGAILGGAAMFGMCTYATVYSYRFQIGGRPQFAWPAFVVPSFSFAMAAGAVVVLFALFVLNRLPRLNHPAFDIPGFTRASNTHFFVAVEAEDKSFDPERVEEVLRSLVIPPSRISRVAR